jgi:hypothetical protein
MSSSASSEAITSYVGRFVHARNRASAPSSGSARASSRTVSALTRQMSAPIPRWLLPSVSMPASARNATRRSVSAASYGVATATRRAPTARSAASMAPLVVTACRAPPASIAARSRASPASPDTKLAEVQRYTVTPGLGTDTS